MLTHEYLLKILHYNPETGNWTWLVDRGTNHVKGKKAGNKRPDGYWRIVINYKQYRAHILAWFYMTRKWPEKDIDHKNNNPNDNYWGNLREATETQNLANQKINIKNTSGYKGVSWNKRAKKWEAYIMKNRKRYHLGLFICPIEAAKAYDKKAKELFGEFALLNFP